EIALDESRHVGAEIGLHIFHVFGKAAENHSAEYLDLERLQPMLADVEILGHAAVAAQAVSERNALQSAVKLVIPGMVDTGEARDVVFLLQADQRALVRTAIDHCVDLAVAITGDNDRHFTHGRGLVVAGIGDLDFEAEIIPGLAAENALLL